MSDDTFKASDLDWGLIVQLGAIVLIVMIVVAGALAQAIFGVDGIAWAGGAILAIAAALGFAGMALSASA